MNKFSQCLMLTLLCCPLAAWGQEPSIVFTAAPERCVALHKGQTCYQDVQFRWKTPEVGQYCLVLVERQQQLTCWRGASVQQYQYSFEGDKTTTFNLIRNGDTNPLAEVKVIVTWVYKAPKQSQSGWRLF
ncbi:DUF3019 domain-containing protein [Shewanella colwelliana]|uniref:DUF3019 domain-containing protein n=1 Tax=Shewanella colwelliana TaxID=23 RepID=A0A1E5IS25_SHECO|nr:DUF3019 domain-containing protein [Shewanella colwelliana]MDX1280086.1 DUF3019 domain-containing protein [Shewanella colwelliana]OEG73344.1 hypothetical protein BEL05_13845 [Shewanella colwelliana]